MVDYTSRDMTEVTILRKIFKDLRSVAINVFPRVETADKAKKYLNRCDLHVQKDIRTRDKSKIKSSGLVKEYHKTSRGSVSEKHFTHKHYNYATKQSVAPIEVNLPR